MPTVLTILGTRPEAIKLAPVVWAFGRRKKFWRSVTVSSSQHTDLLEPFVRQLNIDIDHDLNVMTAAQAPSDVLTRVISGLNSILATEKPDVVLVQGDTTTALAGALAASYARIPVGHVEAGLRTGDRTSPFPEELNRRVIGQLADLHFAATQRNHDALLAEGVDRDGVFNTGNPVVDTLTHILSHSTPGAELSGLLERLAGKRVIALTTHRRENFGDVMHGHMRALRGFTDKHADVAVVFPVHPNPAVRAAARQELSGHERIHLIGPLEYADFVHLLSSAWLIASDSGGIQEEAPTLGRPVLILRDTTERPEALECGVARLAGHSGEQLTTLLEAAIESPDWETKAASVRNPFGRGNAGERIATAIDMYFGSVSKDKQTIMEEIEIENNGDVAGVQRGARSARLAS